MLLVVVCFDRRFLITYLQSSPVPVVLAADSHASTHYAQRMDGPKPTRNTRAHLRGHPRKYQYREMCKRNLPACALAHNACMTQHTGARTPRRTHVSYYVRTQELDKWLKEEAASGGRAFATSPTRARSGNARQELIGNLGALLAQRTHSLTHIHERNISADARTGTCAHRHPHTQPSFHPHRSSTSG